MTREAERRPGEDGVQKMHAGSDITAMVTRRRAACPLVRAAAALGDPAVIAAVEYWHPVSRCPAALRRHAA